jgi:DNA-binding transcriptional ArsR family regulator
MPKRPPVRKSPVLQVVMRTQDDFQWCATRLKALADPDRLRLVTCLLTGPKNVTELAHELDEEMVKISHHLGVLRHADVVQTEKQGKFVVYRLHPEIAASQQLAAQTGASTLDLGCCRLDLPKPGK